MVARFLSLTLLASVAVGCLLLILIWTVSRPLALLAFFAPLVLFCGVLAMQFASLRWLNRADPAPQATLLQIARAWWIESVVAVRVFFWWQAFHADRHPDRVPSDAGDSAGGRGVLLVHGFICNRAIWTRWFPVLQSRSIPYVAVNLEPVFGPIDGYVPILEAAIRKLEKGTGLAPVVVCHSMGGLAVRAWLRAAGNEHRVHHVVTIGSPHHGTRVGKKLPLARWVVNGGQMRHQSDWLLALERQESAQRRRLFTCFYSNCDNIVVPSSTATLVGADNRFVPGAPHLELAKDRDIIEESLRHVVTTTRPDSA